MYTYFTHISYSDRHRDSVEAFQTASFTPKTAHGTYSILTSAEYVYSSNTHDSELARLLAGRRHDTADRARWHAECAL